MSFGFIYAKDSVQKVLYAALPSFYEQYSSLLLGSVQDQASVIARLLLDAVSLR